MAIVPVVALLLGWMGVVTVPAGATQFGEPDGNRHPAVGFAIIQDADGVPRGGCSGTLIDEDTFLTAGHCVAGFAGGEAVIWWDPGPIPFGTWTGGSCAGHTGFPCTGDATGDPIAHPDFTGQLTLPNTNDIGVVELDDPQVGRPTMVLAPARYLDTLATARGQQDTTFAIVGYGAQRFRPFPVHQFTRMLATVSLVELTSALTDGYNVHTTNSPGLGTGPGGSCFGDSGGPLLHWDGTKEVIVGVTSRGIDPQGGCMGSALYHRTDIENSRQFLASFTTLP